MSDEQRATSNKCAGQGARQGDKTEGKTEDETEDEAEDETEDETEEDKTEEDKTEGKTRGKATATVVLPGKIDKFLRSEEKKKKRKCGQRLLIRISVAPRNRRILTNINPPAAHIPSFHTSEPRQRAVALWGRGFSFVDGIAWRAEGKDEAEVARELGAAGGVGEAVGWPERVSLRQWQDGGGFLFPSQGESDESIAVGDREIQRDKNATRWLDSQLTPLKEHHNAWLKILSGPIIGFNGWLVR